MATGAVNDRSPALRLETSKEGLMFATCDRLELMKEHKSTLS